MSGNSEGSWEAEELNSAQRARAAGGTAGAAGLPSASWLAVRDGGQVSNIQNNNIDFSISVYVC